MITENKIEDRFLEAIKNIKKLIEDSIKTSKYTNTKGKKVEKENGLSAKNALIRSSQTIMEIHLAVKDLIKKAITEKTTREYRTYYGSKELTIPGFFKAKKQDIVTIFHEIPKEIEEILLKNRQNESAYRLFQNPGTLKDKLEKTKKIFNESIIINIRSQLSSIDKNFDTLMERTIAEVFNLRLSYPNAILGEVYLIPTREYDDQEAKNNSVKFKEETVNLDKFIRFFHLIAKKNEKPKNYEYDLVLLLIADFKNLKLYTDIDALVADDLLKEDFPQELKQEINRLISPSEFFENLKLAVEKLQQT